MTETPAPSNPQMNRAVVALLDGRRLKGYVFNFSAFKDSFRLFPNHAATAASGTDVLLKDVKAVFFVKDFQGNPEYREKAGAGEGPLGRRIEVTFKDGEKLTGTTTGYNPQKLGFFIFPLDPNDNNARIFVVNKNARNVKFV